MKLHTKFQDYMFYSCWEIYDGNFCIRTDTRTEKLITIGCRQLVSRALIKLPNTKHEKKLLAKLLFHRYRSTENVFSVQKEWISIWSKIIFRGKYEERRMYLRDTGSYNFIKHEKLEAEKRSTDTKCRQKRSTRNHVNTKKLKIKMKNTKKRQKHCTKITLYRFLCRRIIK